MMSVEEFYKNYIGRDMEMWEKRLHEMIKKYSPVIISRGRDYGQKQFLNNYKMFLKYIQMNKETNSPLPRHL